MNKNVEERIRNFGFRVTPQRQLILDAVAAAGEHATFDRIYEEVRARSDAISKATVYRTLEVFSIHRLIHGNEVKGEKIYEVVAERHHHHLICQRCGNDEKIDHDPVAELFDYFDDQYDFLALGEHFIFMGLCAQCRRELKEAGSKKYQKSYR
jgi:Fur family ferric uptake transcriptional regulator